MFKTDKPGEPAAASNNYYVDARTGVRSFDKSIK